MKTQNWALLLLLLPVFAFGQTNATDFHFGISINAQKSRLEIFTTDWERLGITNLAGIEISEKIGFRLGVDFTYGLGKKTALNFSPGYYYTDNKIHFSTKDEPKVSVDIFRNGISLPFTIQYAPQTLQKGPRFFAGMEFQTDMGPKDQDLISLYAYNLLAKFGCALPIQGNRIKWTPTLSYSMGLDNIKKFVEGPSMNPAIDAIQLNTISFGVIFELGTDIKKVD